VTYFLGAAAIVAASVYSGSVIGDAIDAAHKEASGMHLPAANPLPAAGAMIVAGAILAFGVWLRTRWPLPKTCAVGAGYAFGIAGVAIIQSILPLNA
jgi:hypothetical protein